MLFQAVTSTANQCGSAIWLPGTSLTLLKSEMFLNVVERLVNSQLSKLPSFLVKHPGLVILALWLPNMLVLLLLLKISVLGSSLPKEDSIPSRKTKTCQHVELPVARGKAEIHTLPHRGNRIMAACRLDLEPENHESGQGSQTSSTTSSCQHVCFIEFG